MPRGRPKGSKNKNKTEVALKPIPSSPATGSFFDNTKNLLPEMLVERLLPVVVPHGFRRVSFSGFDIPNCHRLAKMLMTKYGYTDPSMPKLKKNGGGWYTFEITEPKASK